MNSHDEKFLKDLLWSENWFPWKSKTRVVVVHGDKAQIWQKVAAVISSLALLVSISSMFYTQKQVTLMRAQLTSGDRNAANIQLAKLLNKVCLKISEGPSNAVRYDPYADETGKIYYLPIIAGKRTEVTATQRDEFARELRDLVTEVGLAMVVASMFNNEQAMRELSNIQRLIAHHAQAAVNAVTDDSVAHLDQRRFTSLYESCKKSESSAMKGSGLPSLQYMNEIAQ